MKEFFPEVTRPIRYEGPNSKNPLSFRYYDADRKVGDKTMAEQLRFAVAYWHTYRGTGSDPFGGPSMTRPWGTESDPVAAAETTLEAHFEFLRKLGVKLYCFHDRDIAPEGASISETNKILDGIVKRAKKLQADTGTQLLWGTANLFSHARYSHGAATNPDPLVFAHGAAQIRRAIDATIELGGTGYVFWGGREGYSSFLNTNLKQEREQLASMLQMAADYARKSGFKGMFFIEPKPAEPSTHQYDFDAATSLGFLREFNLMENFALNIEANHATLAGHTFEHELQVASNAGKLGSIDINRGNPLLGWDTDQFPTDRVSATLAMNIVLKQGGLKFGGLNFDSKVRRGSFDTIDLFHAHIGGMDTFAYGLLVAERMQKDGVFTEYLKNRYAGYETPMGQKILSRQTNLAELETWAAQQGEPKRVSGREEMLENILNDYLYSSRIE